ncbi:hypothetical protein EVAR_33191_1 [Eumeta japonica]|uniref:Uncharacterized protein n=1 Tax=Eumeta variegata TaxID=151549 RepID=A0A4C1W0M3_EUMVA|nr:hypothetical protein EVAR_33191_1 [Eumeta japonica]
MYRFGRVGCNDDHFAFTTVPGLRASRVTSMWRTSAVFCLRSRLFVKRSLENSTEFDAKTKDRAGTLIRRTSGHRRMSASITFLEDVMVALDFCSITPCIEWGERHSYRRRIICGAGGHGTDVEVETIETGAAIRAEFIEERHSCT